MTSKLPLGHEFDPGTQGDAEYCWAHVSMFGHGTCGQSRAAHEAQPDPDDAEDVAAALETRRLYESEGIGAFVRYKDYPLPTATQTLPDPEPEQPSDRLGMEATKLCSMLSGASHEEFEPEPCDDCSLIRAALEALVRDCAEKAWQDAGAGCPVNHRTALLERFGLKEKP